ncbi:transposase [Treponema sp.]|uniref:transposase n=1 Tax=Treponema sp. TaxID=166 RepID=UPI0038901E61
MARTPRLFGCSGFYHVILRGNNRQNLFVDDADRSFFVGKLKKYSGELAVVVHAYCLMNNHVHILIGNVKENETLSLLIQKIANSYVFYFNRKYDRCGHLFQGRFKSEPILDDVYFKTVYRYILQNCEKAGLGNARQYRWNSFWALKDHEKNDFVDVEYVIGLFNSKKELLDFLNQREEQKCMEYENILVFSDDRAIKLIKKIFRISSPYKLERLTIDDQISKCGILKKKGLSISQISRITGISRVIVKKS